MDADEFKLKLHDLGLSYAQAAKHFNTTGPAVKMAIKREKVPLLWLRILDTLTMVEAVTTEETIGNNGQPVTTLPVTAGDLLPWPIDPRREVTTLEVIRPTDDEKGDVAFDIMSDGFARGYPGDDWIMRATYRTAHAWRRICEKRDPKLVEDRITHMAKFPRRYRINREGQPLELDGRPIVVEKDIYSVALVQGEHITRKS